VLGVVSEVVRGCQKSAALKFAARRVELDDAPEADEAHTALLLVISALEEDKAIRQRCSPLSSPLRFTSPRPAGGRLPRERVADSPYWLIVSRIMQTLGQVRSHNLHPLQTYNNPGGLTVKKNSL